MKDNNKIIWSNWDPEDDSELLTEYLEDERAMSRKSLLVSRATQKTAS